MRNFVTYLNLLLLATVAVALTASVAFAGPI
jgi:hypothetical protein